MRPPPDELQARRKSLEVAAREIEIDFPVLDIRDRYRRTIVGERSDHRDQAASLYHAHRVGDRALLEAADAFDHFVETAAARRLQRSRPHVAFTRVERIRIPSSRAFSRR